jgi:hypothetical protein
MKMAAQTRFWIRHACRDIPAPFSANVRANPHYQYTLSGINIHLVANDLYVTSAVDLIAINICVRIRALPAIGSNLHGDHFTLHLTAAATAQGSACSIF